MLYFMRKHAGTWMIKALLGAIVVVFIFWGVGSWTSQREGIVATVNGEPITLDDYRNTYNRLLDQARQSLAGGLSEEVLKSLQLEKSAMDQLIDRTLLRQTAARLKLQVSDEELSRSIRATAAFHSNGSFDRRRYQQVLSLNRLTPETFEVNQRDALLIEKLSRFVTDSVKVSDSETEEWYRWNQAAVKVGFVSVDTERYKNVSVSDEEARQYYERTKESYRTEPEIRVRYLHFKPEDYFAKIAVTEEEIGEFYESNPERFVVPKTVEARHILIRVPVGASPEAVNQAQNRIREVLQQIREGQNFAKLAEQYSEDEATRDRGGALGAFPKEAMVQPFGDAAFALQVGQVSEPVKTQFGWHLIQVDRINEGHTRSLEQAKDEIRDQMRRERARNLAYDEAEAVYDAAAGSTDLSAAAAARQIEVHTTEFFPRSGSVKGVASPGQFAQAAFQLAQGDISEIQEIEDGFYILQVSETKPVHIPEFSAVEADVNRDVRREKQLEMARKDAQTLLEDVQQGVALEQAAKKIGATLQTSGFVKRNDSIEGLGYEPEAIRMAFQLSQQNPLPSEPIRTARGYAVIRFMERQTSSTEGFEKERNQLRDRLLQQKKFKSWEVWLEQLRQQGKIDRRHDYSKI